MAVKIYKRLTEWWREPTEVIGEGDNKEALRKKFLEKKLREEEFEDEENFDNTMEDDLNGEEMVPGDVQDPADIVDDVEGEERADAIADQISLTIDGQEYYLVPAGEEGIEGEGADLGLDSTPEMDDVSQPMNAEGGEENFANNNMENSNEEEDLNEAHRKRIKAIKEKILKRRMALNEEDEFFIDGEEAAPVGSGDEIGGVMEALNKKIAKLSRELESLKVAKKFLREDTGGELDMPKAKDKVQLAATSGPKNADTFSDSGEDFTKTVGKGDKLAKRGPGTPIKSAQTFSDAGDNKTVKNATGSASFSARGPGSAPKKAYTPSDSGPHPRELESFKARLAKRMKSIKEEEDLNDKMPDPKKTIDNFEDIEDQRLEVAETTDDLISEKLQKVRLARKLRREGVEKNGVTFPNEEIKADLESTLQESFDYKKFLTGDYK